MGVYCPSCGRKVEDEEHCSFCNARLTGELEPFESEEPIKEGVDSGIYLPTGDKATVRPIALVALVVVIIGSFAALSLGGQASDRSPILLNDVGRRKSVGSLALEINTNRFSNSHSGTHSAWALEQFNSGGENFTEADFAERFAVEVTSEASFEDIQALFAEQHSLYGPFNLVGFSTAPSDTESFAVVATRGPAYLGMYLLTEDVPPFKIKMLWFQTEQ